MDLVECDVRATADGVLVLLHDETLDRTTNGSGPVAQTTFETLRTLDAGKGERVPTLEEFLDLIRGRCGAHVELKAHEVPEPTFRLVQQKGMLDSIIFTSGQTERLAAVRRMSDQASFEHIFADPPPDALDRALSVGASRVSVHHTHLTREFVEAMPMWREHGLLAFTINLQGGSPEGYSKEQPWHNSALTADGDVPVAAAVEAFIAKNPPPVPVEHKWFGLTYINVVWQEKMVSGMLEAFLGSFLIVFLMMTFVYRSALWGILSMIPLTVTIGLIYGAIGFAGKDYDMPVAVLSSLSLGLAVDYAIHFLSRSRELRDRFGEWRTAVGHVFGEPARAIARNAIVVGVGFLPLLLAPLVPYQTVGTFIAAILFTAGVASILILPALVTLLERILFPETRIVGLLCRCGTLLASGASLAAAVVINIHQFFDVGWTALTPWAVGVILLLVVICFFTRRSRLCYTEEAPLKGDDK